jgi:hypothetical protein
MLNLTLVGMICGIRYSGKEFSNRNRQLQTICNEHKELIYKGTPVNFSKISPGMKEILYTYNITYEKSKDIYVLKNETKTLNSIKRYFMEQKIYEK